MSGKKIAIVVTNVIDKRMDCLKEILWEEDLEFKIFVSDFSHTHKKIQRDNPEYTYVETKPYKKNISFARIKSHLNFAKKTVKLLEDFKPDIVYVQFPPNALVKQCVKYKKRSGCKLIFDMMDMWPESLPIGGVKKIVASPLLLWWKNLRNKHIKKADFLITECSLFKDELVKQGVKLPNIKVIYLCGKKINPITPDLPTDKLNFCYLGSINNIIDIDYISDLLNKINSQKKVCVHIIGGGERGEEFIKSFNNIDVVNHGKVFDRIEKSKIFSVCHFGINIYKECLKIGLTIKSIDYLQAGLPLVNNINSDTAFLVEKYNAGINNPTTENILKMSDAEILSMRQNAQKLFDENLEFEKIKGQLKAVILGLHTSPQPPPHQSLKNLCN